MQGRIFTASQVSHGKPPALVPASIPPAPSPPLLRQSWSGCCRCSQGARDPRWSDSRWQPDGRAPLRRILDGDVPHRPDGSGGQPKFSIPSVRDALAAGGRIDGRALVSALWCRYCHGTTDSGTPVPANDPNWDDLQAQSRAAMDAPVIWLQVKPIYGDLNRDPRFVAAFTKALNSLWENGTPGTLATCIAS
jgi:hypothetical protein